MENKNDTTIKRKVLISRNPDINFIYGKLKQSCRYAHITYWINNDDFANRVRELQKQNATITDRMVYDIMRDIYLSKSKIWSNTGVRPDFNFYAAKRCIKSLHYSFTGSKTGWETR